MRPRLGDGARDRVVPSDELDALVEEFASKLMAGPPIALATSKKLLNQSFTSTLDEALDAEGIERLPVRRGHG